MDEQLTPEDVCRTIVQLNVMGLWPKDAAMQGLAENAMKALEGQKTRTTVEEPEQRQVAIGERGRLGVRTQRKTDKQRKAEQGGD